MRHMKLITTVILLTASLVVPEIPLFASDEMPTVLALQKARALTKRKKYTEAVAFLKERFDKTDDTELLLQLSDVYAKMKNTDQAVCTLDDMIDRLRDQYRVTLYDRALFKKANDKLTRLCRNRKTLLKINAKVAKQFLALARSRLKNSDPSTFQAALDLVDQIDPRNPGAEVLRDVYAHGGKTPRKWRDLTKTPIDYAWNNKGPDGNWLAVNSFPGVKSKWVKAMKASGHFTRGRKWFILHPHPVPGYEKEKIRSYVEFRFSKPVSELKGMVAVAHPDKGVVKFIVTGGDTRETRKQYLCISSLSKNRRPVEYHIKFPPTKWLTLQIHAFTDDTENIGAILDPMVR